MSPSQLYLGVIELHKSIEPHTSERMRRNPRASRIGPLACGSGRRIYMMLFLSVTLREGLILP